VTPGCLIAAPAVSAAQSPTVLALRTNGSTREIVKDILASDVPVLGDR
jgi:hypothetical protein